MYSSPGSSSFLAGSSSAGPHWDHSYSPQTPQRNSQGYLPGFLSSSADPRSYAGGLSDVDMSQSTSFSQGRGSPSNTFGKASLFGPSSGYGVHGKASKRGMHGDHGGAGAVDEDAPPTTSLMEMEQSSSSNLVDRNRGSLAKDLPFQAAPSPGPGARSSPSLGRPSTSTSEPIPSRLGPNSILVFGVSPTSAKATQVASYFSRYGQASPETPSSFSANNCNWMVITFGSADACQMALSEHGSNVAFIPAIGVVGLVGEGNPALSLLAQKSQSQSGDTFSSGEPINSRPGSTANTVGTRISASVLPTASVFRTATASSSGSGSPTKTNPHGDIFQTAPTTGSSRGSWSRVSDMIFGF